MITNERGISSLTNNRFTFTGCAFSLPTASAIQMVSIKSINEIIDTDENITTAPQIVHKKELVGGYTELSHYLKKYYFNNEKEF